MKRRRGVWNCESCLPFNVRTIKLLFGFFFLFIFCFSRFPCNICTWGNPKTRHLSTSSQSCTISIYFFLSKPHFYWRYRGLVWEKFIDLFYFFIIIFNQWSINSFLLFNYTFLKKSHFSLVNSIPNKLQIIMYLQLKL